MLKWMTSLKQQTWGVSRQETNASATLGGFYEWTGNIWVYPAGWLRSRAEKISTYSMIHHNKVFGRGWWCHRWRWWGVICESERKKKRRRWRRKRIRKRGELKKKTHGEVGYLLCVTHGNKRCWPVDDSPQLYQPCTLTSRRDAHAIRHDTHGRNNKSYTLS